MQVRNNIMVALTDMTVQYTVLVDAHIPHMAACLADPNELVRRQALALLASLLSRVGQPLPLCALRAACSTLAGRRHCQTGNVHGHQAFTVTVPRYMSIGTPESASVLVSRHVPMRAHGERLSTGLCEVAGPTVPPIPEGAGG